MANKESRYWRRASFFLSVNLRHRPLIIFLRGIVIPVDVPHLLFEPVYFLMEGPVFRLNLHPEGDHFFRPLRIFDGFPYLALPFFPELFRIPFFRLTRAAGHREHHQCNNNHSQTFHFHN